jgi:hypothetical protein
MFGPPQKQYQQIRRKHRDVLANLAKLEHSTYLNAQAKRRCDKAKEQVIAADEPKTIAQVGDVGGTVEDAENDTDSVQANKE